MRLVLRRAAVAFGIVGLAASFAAVSGTAAFAQAKKDQMAPAKQAAPAPAPEPGIKQLALTDQQIQGVLAAHKEIDALAEKLPDKPGAKPDPKIIAQLDATAKKYGFASYADYNDVVDNISVVLGGIDPKSKTYVGQQAMVKQQIAAVQADSKMTPKDKKEALEDLNEALKAPEPAIDNKGNIELVTKNYEKLDEALTEDE
jgi:hypothetical protein